MSLLHSIRRKVAYRRRHFTPTWRYGFNFKSTLAYRLKRPVIIGEAARVLDELNQNGIAITSVEKLLGGSSCFDELNQAVDQLETEWAARINDRREEANRYDTTRKTFILQLLGDHPQLDPASVYARFALQLPILQIANEYFGMYTRLRFYNVWHTLTTETDPRESQLWHFDREDHLILKLFVYLSEVDDGAGPINYAPGTHIKGKVKRHPESFLENGVRRVRDEQMAEIVPEQHWIKGTGPKGMMVFADTRGYHKGGLARTRDKIMYTCLFTSPTSQAEELFVRPESIAMPQDRAQAKALALRYH